MIPPGARQVLQEALGRSGEILNSTFGKVRIRYKGRANLVTRADTESQRIIRSLILRKFPRHDFRGEEGGERRAGSDYVWLVDPLDGTTNFAHGYPVACVSVGLLHRGQPILAGIYDPFRDELFTAERGKGAFLNEKPLRVSPTASLSAALLITGFPYDRSARSHFYVEYYRSFMILCHDIRRSGSASLDMAWVAAGRADGFWEFRLNPWDVAAGWLLVSEAGGRVSDFSGRAWSYPENIARQTLATNGRLHGSMLKVLSKLKKMRPEPRELPQ